ncbi:MAG: hypothetical protein R2749_16205 [Acidimicrobiales bacterium]
MSEVTDAATAAALLDAFPDRLALIQSDAFIARLTAQSCRLPGVALAYEELLSFRGSQLYLHREPAAVGLPFGDVVCGFVDACVIGLHDAGGVIELSPPMDRLVGEDDQLIVIAHAADRITWAGPGPAPSAPAPLAVVEGGEDIVVCGWNHLAPRIVDELDHYLPEGSTVTVLVDERHRRTATRALPARLAHGTVVVDSAAGDAHSTLVHDRCRGADHVVILSPDDATSATDADARALVQMLAVREVLTRAARSATLVTELLDERDADLAPRASAGDFIISERLSSLLLTQIAQNRQLAAIFARLLAPEGGQLYCKPVRWFADHPVAMSFGELTRLAGRHGDCLIGCRVVAAAADPVGGFGVALNPGREARFVLDPDDQLIVVSRKAR